MPFRHFLVLALFAADLAALLAVLGSAMPRRVKAKWVAAIVLLPIAGIVLWLRRGGGGPPGEPLNRSALPDRSREPRR